MAALTKLEVAQLQELQKSDAWDIVVKKLDERIASINARGMETTADNAFEELRAKHKCQGGTEELKKFFDDLEKGAFE